jgi:hypothetical protein
MNARILQRAARATFASTAVAATLALGACASDDGVTTSSHVSVGVGYGYGGYYGPYYGGGYYAPYPPVVVVPPGDRPDRPNGGNRPTTLPSQVDGPSAKSSMAPSRPSTASRATARPSPRPAPRPMPRAGRMR